MSHAGDWLLFDENLGESLSIDETCLSSGEVYTFLTNKAGKGGRGTLVAVVRGTKAEDVIRVLEKIDLSKKKDCQGDNARPVFLYDDHCAHGVPQGTHHQ